MANLIRNRAHESNEFGPRKITVIGVVDGKDPAQREIDEQISTLSGTTHLILTFEHVPLMLTEDSQQLIGYTSIRREMMLIPLRSNAVMRITNDDGELLYSCGALGADSLLRSVIRMHQPDAERDPEDIDFMGQVISFAVAHFSIGKEYAMLQNAYQFGLLDEKDAKSIKDGMEKNYTNAVMSDRPP